MSDANLLQSGNRARTGHALRGGLALAVTGVVMVVLALAPHAAAAPPEGVPGGGPPDGVTTGPPEGTPAHGTFKVKPGDFEPGDHPSDQRNVPHISGCGVHVHFQDFGEATDPTFELIGPSAGLELEGELEELEGDSGHRNGYLVRVTVPGHPGQKVFWFTPDCEGGGDPELIIETITVVFVEDEDEDDIEIGDPLVVENPAGPQADPPAAPPVDTPGVAVLGVEHERTAPAPELPRTGAGTIGLAAAGLLALLLGVHLMAWSRRLAPVAVPTRR